MSAAAAAPPTATVAVAVRSADSPLDRILARLRSRNKSAADSKNGAQTKAAAANSRVDTDSAAVVDVKSGAAAVAGDSKSVSLSVVPARRAVPYAQVVAPMVRYSKLPFRLLCARWGADMAVTPMMVASSFARAEQARRSEFTTTPLANDSKHSAAAAAAAATAAIAEIRAFAGDSGSDGGSVGDSGGDWIARAVDTPVIAQFAANRTDEMAAAAMHVARYVDGVDLNCGCPQKWAVADGLGAGLLRDPSLIADMVKAVRSATAGLGARSGPSARLSISIKIRVDEPLRLTIDLLRAVEAAGVDWVTVHGRTARQRSCHAVNVEAIAAVKAAATVPVLANGDLFSGTDCDAVVAATAVDGVMSARGLLCNPALFAVDARTGRGFDAGPPVECIADYLRLALSFGGAFPIHHHHLMYMLAAHGLSKPERAAFAAVRSMPAAVDFFRDRGVDAITGALVPPAAAALF